MTQKLPTFKVMDNKTNKILGWTDLQEIAKNEDWAKDLIHVDMEGFAITQEGLLILMDECGAYRFCPEDRFSVLFPI